MRFSYINVTTTFNGTHRYKDAPNEVAFLREFHRHKFFVGVNITTTHGDRELEFMMVQRRLNDYIKETFSEKQFELSCENIASKILEEFLFKTYGENRFYSVSVSEDAENTGGVHYRPDSQKDLDTICFQS